MKTKNPRMMLLRKEDRKNLPPLYSQEKVKDPMVWVKFFTPDSSWSWFATEFDQKDTFFGWVVGLEKELGYFSFSELQRARGPLGLYIERDMHFRPRPLSEVKRRHQEYGAANPRRSEGPFEAVQRKLARQTLNMPSEIAGVMGPPSVADSYYILKKCPKCGKRTVRNQILGANICYKCKRMFYPGDMVGIPVPTGNPKVFTRKLAEPHTTPPWDYIWIDENSGEAIILWPEGGKYVVGYRSKYGWPYRAMTKALKKPSARKEAIKLIKKGNPKKRFALIPSEREKECTDHVFRYTGKTPNTGPQVCYLCGIRKEDVKNPRESRTIMDWSKKLYAMKSDKFIVRVVGWKTARTRAIFGVTLPRESITSINEIPKSAEWVMVAFFKPDGKAAGKSARVSLATMRKHMILTA